MRIRGVELKLARGKNYFGLRARRTHEIPTPPPWHDFCSLWAYFFNFFSLYHQDGQVFYAYENNNLIAALNQFFFSLRSTSTQLFLIRVTMYVQRILIIQTTFIFFGLVSPPMLPVDIPATPKITNLKEIRKLFPMKKNCAMVRPLPQELFSFLNYLYLVFFPFF